MNLKIENINIESSTSEKLGVKLSDKSTPMNTCKKSLKASKLSLYLGFSISLT